MSREKLLAKHRDAMAGMIKHRVGAHTRNADAHSTNATRFADALAKSDDELAAAVPELAEACPPTLSLRAYVEHRERSARSDEALFRAMAAHEEGKTS